ncbi:MAG: hypothetical protein J6R16_07395 [Alistipes sp.]|nr:hypothetical protein [Alistipes sp.]
MSRTYIEVTYIDPNVCFECGAPATERHHIVPASLGGTKTVPLCGICHAKIHDVDGKRRTRIAELTKAALDAKKARGETWVRNTDTRAANAASARASKAAREKWLKESEVSKYVLARWMEGISFMDILRDLEKMYATTPNVYCSREGKQIGKGQLSKMISFYKEWKKDYIPQNKIRFLLQWAQKANKPFNLQLSCNLEGTISSNNEKGYILYPTGSFIKEYELKYWEEFFQLLRSFYIIKERYDSNGKVYYVFASDTMIIRLVNADIENTPIDKNVLKKIGMGL